MRADDIADLRQERIGIFDLADVQSKALEFIVAVRVFVVMIVVVIVIIVVMMVMVMVDFMACGHVIFCALGHTKQDIGAETFHARRYKRHTIPCARLKGVDGRRGSTGHCIGF